jgi:phage/plasmid-like protein (TIGR03299 family)
MAHEVENMFSVKETPWHGLGKIVTEAPTAEEAIVAAGLNWKVVEQPLYRGGSFPDAAELVTSHKALIRDTDNKQLGIVGVGYKPLQNEKAFNFFNPFIDSGLASFETAGSLREGKTVWILAKLNKAPIEIGKGDAVNKYLLLSNGHDGSMAVRTGFTPIRVVCANTLAMSHSNDKSRLLRVNHSSRVNENLDKIRDIVNAADAKFEATADQYRALSRSDVSQKELEAYVEIVFQFKNLDAERRALAKKKAVENIQRLFETGYGQDLKGAKGTYWGLYNAVTQYLSYEKGRNEDSRLNSLWFGNSSVINQRALDKAVHLVAV